MSGFLTFSSLGISAGMLIYGISEKIVPPDLQLILILVLIASGIVISYVAVRSGKAQSREEMIKVTSEAVKLANELKK